MHTEPDSKEDHRAGEELYRTAAKGNIIQIDEGQVRQHLADIVRGSVEEKLNAMLEKEADEFCKAQRNERAQGRVRPGTRAQAGHHGR